jgi:hypothetical protein
MRFAMHRFMSAVVVAATVEFHSPCRAAQPERVVSDNVVISRQEPTAEIKVPASFRYVGADRFVLTDSSLGDFDDCELHAFVEADEAHTIRALYWVQFEAYLPNHSELHHTYDSPRHATMAGLDFYVDTWVSASTAPPEQGSDDAHFYSLLASHGYRREDLMSVRLVHLDATRRKELMIIYSETLAPTGYTASELKAGGKEHEKWAALEAGLIRRAEQSLTITQDAGHGP